MVTEQQFQVDGFGTVLPTPSGLLFKLDINSQLFTFLISPEKTIDSLMVSIDRTLKTLGIGKENRASVMKAIAEIMPSLANFDVVKPKVYVPFWNDGPCYEAVRMNGKDIFFYTEGGHVRTCEYIDTAACRVHPTQYVSSYEFPSVPVVIPTLNEIFDRVHNIVSSYYYHPDARLLKFLSLYIIHSYILTRSIGSVFLWFIGARRSGKTTYQIICDKLGYRPFSGVAPSDASIYRTLGWEVEYGPMIIIREFEKASDIMREINREGDIPGAWIPRVDKEYERQIVRSYHVYGSRVCASNKLHGEDADDDRYMFIRSVHGKPAKPRNQLYRNKEVASDLNETRNEILLWKLANYDQFTVPDSDSQLTEGRDWEHYGGIITLAKMISEDMEAEMRGFLSEYLNQKEEDSKNTTISLIASIILKRAKEGALKEGIMVKIPSETIWHDLQDQCSPFYDDKGNMSTTKLTAPDGRTISTTWVGRVIKEQLFGRRTAWREGQNAGIRGYQWTEDDLKALEGASVAGVASVAGLGAFMDDKKGDFKNNETILKDDKNNAQTTIKPATPATPATNSGIQNLDKTLISEMVQKDGKTYVRCKDHMTDAEGKERWFCKDDGEWEAHLQRQHGAETGLETVLDIFKKLCGPDNKGATEAEALAELKKTGIEEPEGVKLIASLKRNGQIYESSPGRFSVTKS